MTKIYTEPVIIATAGKTSDGRELKEETLERVAANYDKNLRAALINLEHGWGNYGEVESLEFKEHETLPGKKALYAVLSPNRFLLGLNKASEEGTYFSIEYVASFPPLNGPYLTALAVTNHPASVGTTRLRFQRQSEEAIRSQFSVSPQNFKPKISPLSKLKRVFTPAEEPLPSQEERDFRFREDCRVIFEEFESQKQDIRQFLRSAENALRIVLERDSQQQNSSEKKEGNHVSNIL